MESGKFDQGDWINIWGGGRGSARTHGCSRVELELGRRCGLQNPPPPRVARRAHSESRRVPLCRPRPRAAAAKMRVPLAGGGQETLLSEVGFVLLPLFSTRDACALRLVCREFLAAVSEHPWEDRDTVIQGSIAAWRACFPQARCANVQFWSAYDDAETRATPVVDADFVHF